MGTLTARGGTLTPVGGHIVGLGSSTAFPTLADFDYARGANLAGGEFDHTAAGLPGTYGGNHRYSSLEYCQYIRSRGHRIVRIPFRWERIQHTLSGPLDPTGVGHLKTAVANAREAGLMVLLDMHNYCRYYRLDDVMVMAEQGYTTADFADAWGKLAAEFAAEPGVAAWGLMNEPFGLPTYGPFITPSTTFHTFAAGTEGWSVSGSGHAIAHGSYPWGAGADGAVEVTKVMPSSGNNYSSVLRMSPASGGGSPVRSGNWPAGEYIRFEVFIPESTPGDWRCRPEAANAAFQVVPGEYQRIPKGVVTHLYYQVPEALSGTAHAGAGLQFESRQNDGTTPSVIKIGQVDIGVGAGPRTAWHAHSQAATDAIRAEGDTRPIFVAGDQFGGAEGWAAKNGATAWVTDPADNIYYEAHYYCSQAYNASGFTTYADAEADAVARGWANLTARVTAEIGEFTSWLTTNNVKGFIGEIGWPKTETELWNPIGSHMFDLLDAAGVGSTQWTAGEAWSIGQPLNLYEGQGSGPITVNPQAATVEAHPSQLAA